MIKEEKIYCCRRCSSKNIKKNGFNYYGNQRYYCKDCKASKVLEPKIRYTQERKEEMIQAYLERPSMRGISRIFGVHRNTFSKWFKKKQKDNLALKQP